MTRYILLLLMLSSLTAHAVIGDLIINYQNNNTGPAAELRWTKTNSTIWGVDSTGTLKGFVLGSGLIISGDTSIGLNTSTGGNWTADSGKVVVYQGNGEITATSTLTVVATTGTWKPSGQLQPDLLTFQNVGGNLGRFYTLALPVGLSGSRYIYLPSAAGTIARLEDITLAQLPQTGATSGQGIVWNGTSWAPGTVGGALTVGTTSISSGTAGRIVYETSGNKVGEVSSVTSDGTLLTMSRVLTVTQGTSNESVITSTGYSVSGSNTTPMLNFAGTWNTTGAPTAFKINITNTASSSSSLLMDLQVGGVSTFQVKTNGQVVTNPSFGNYIGTSGFGFMELGSNTLATMGVWGGNGMVLPATVGLYWTDADLNGTRDCVLRRAAPATVQLGTNANADADDQTIKSADGITGTNKSGGDLTLSSGNSTGSGSSAVIFKAPVAGSSGTTARTAVERGRVDSKGIRAGKIVIWGDPTTTPAAEATADCFYLYVDPADGNLKVMSGNTGTVTTIAIP